MGIPWDGMGCDRHELLWNGMGWDRKICPMDKPGENVHNKYKKQMPKTAKKLHLTKKTVVEI